jgi:hypothetical protein
MYCGRPHPGGTLGRGVQRDRRCTSPHPMRILHRMDRRSYCVERDCGGCGGAGPTPDLGDGPCAPAGARNQQSSKGVLHEIARSMGNARCSRYEDYPISPVYPCGTRWPCGSGQRPRRQEDVVGAAGSCVPGARCRTSQRRATYLVKLTRNRGLPFGSHLRDACADRAGVRRAEFVGRRSFWVFQCVVGAPPTIVPSRGNAFGSRAGSRSA